MLDVVQRRRDGLSPVWSPPNLGQRGDRPACNGSPRAIPPWGHVRRCPPSTASPWDLSRDGGGGGRGTHSGVGTVSASWLRDSWDLRVVYPGPLHREQLHVRQRPADHV